MGEVWLFEAELATDCPQTTVAPSRLAIKEADPKVNSHIQAYEENLFNMEIIPHTFNRCF